MADTATTVIHIRSAPPKPWDPATHVYIGRPSKWGNPYSPLQHGRRGCINMFRQRLRQRPDLIEQARKELKGRALICFCAPDPCHGDVLREVAEGGNP